MRYVYARFCERVGVLGSDFATKPHRYGQTMTNIRGRKQPIEIPVRF